MTHQVVYAPYGARVEMEMDGMPFRLEMQVQIQADTKSLLGRQAVRSLQECKLQPQLFVTLDSRGLPIEPVLLSQRHEVYGVELALAWTTQASSFVGWGPLMAPWIYDPSFDWELRVKALAQAIAVKLFPTAKCESVFTFAGGIMIAYDTDLLRLTNRSAQFEIQMPMPAVGASAVAVTA